jgi:hypothetical protein
MTVKEEKYLSASECFNFIKSADELLNLWFWAGGTFKILLLPDFVVHP